MSFAPRGVFAVKRHKATQIPSGGAQSHPPRVHMPVWWPMQIGPRRRRGRYRASIHWHMGHWHVCTYARAVLKSTQTAQSHPNPTRRGPIAPASYGCRCKLAPSPVPGYIMRTAPCGHMAHACAYAGAVLKSTQTAQSHPNPIRRGPIAPPRVHMPVWLPMHWPRRRYRAIMRTAPCVAIWPMCVYVGASSLVA